MRIAAWSPEDAVRKAISKSESYRADRRVGKGALLRGVPNLEGPRWARRACRRAGPPDPVFGRPDGRLRPDPLALPTLVLARPCHPRSPSHDNPLSFRRFIWEVVFLPAHKTFAVPTLSLLSIGARRGPEIAWMTIYSHARTGGFRAQSASRQQKAFRIRPSDLRSPPHIAETSSRQQFLVVPFLHLWQMPWHVFVAPEPLRRHSVICLSSHKAPQSLA